MLSMAEVVAQPEVEEESPVVLSLATSHVGVVCLDRKIPQIRRELVANLFIANKDIALLCALTKECRKDKFRISWDRVARWIGPNVTGGAIEQHVAKLYSKLKDHRTSLEPKRKKRKGANNVEDDNNEGDFVEDEDIWNRGNEAFANIFYANPDTSSGIQDEDANYDFEGDARAGDYYHKEPVANYGGDYEEEGDWHSQLVQASQGYGGTTGGQSYPTEYDAFDSLGQGMPAIPSPYGYANSSAGNSIPNYGNNCKCFCLES